jgi:hypothetical protein
MLDRQPISSRLALAAIIAPLAVGPLLQAAQVTWTVQETGPGTVVPCRIHLADSAGRPVKAGALPFWRDHFVCDGKATLELAPGRYVFAIERGPEYFAVTGKFEVLAGQSLLLTNQLRRLADLAAEGWWSGDTHVHRELKDIELLMRAEDLHVAPVITWWNGKGPWASQPLPTAPLVRFDGNRFYHLLGGEDERGGGALLYFHLPAPLELSGAKREFPPSLRFLQEAKRQPAPPTNGATPVWAEIEKPFWWDTPVWLASGLADSVGIAHNHLQRGGMLDNEAWGRGRDRAQYPPAWGNGLWTQDIYYHILNTGFRLPPSAGSASGVLPNPVGYNRVYVQVNGELTHEKWWEGLRAGRVFVSNGPLLRCRANGQWPGHIFKSERPIEVLLEGRLEARDRLAAVELIHNGRTNRLALPQRVILHESGWFLVRAIADVTNTFRFASTGPWHVEIGAQPPPVQRASAQFFLDWVRARMAGLKPDAMDTSGEAVGSLRGAETFWQQKVAAAAQTTTLRGEVFDALTSERLPCRLYLQGENGRWYFPESTQGPALRYERRNWINTNAVEFHTTLPAGPFQIELAPGAYTLSIERGKEYRPLTQQIKVADQPLTVRLPLQRWVDMAGRGWFSGDTHVHRTPAELPNLMLAEDLNVAFPLTYWVTKGFTPPTQGDKNTAFEKAAGPVQVDARHVYWPCNTEYEIFSLNGRSHTLGAVFALGHKAPFAMGAPPVAAIAAQARREGALLDLDKHDWPWSMALVPAMGVDLYELANNHHWRTEFGITNWSTPAPAWMGLPNQGRHGSELDWTLYTFQNYYALLDCGFRMRPTAGTANGVHPVPLGFSRVYVHLPEGFSYAGWLKGLQEGRSFVTTGPMLLVDLKATEATGLVLSEQPVTEVEVVINGEVRHRLKMQAQQSAQGAYEARFRHSLQLEGTTWVAVRCFEPRVGTPPSASGAPTRCRFAHTAPAWFDVADKPLRPRKEEVDFLTQRVREQIERSANLLPAEAVAEYRQALAKFEEIAKTAR